MRRKRETLKDGTTVLIRDMHYEDLDKLMKFYRSLPLDDRVYLKVDVTKRKVVEQRMKLIEQGTVFRIIALQDNEIVGDGMFEISKEEWRKHQGEIRVIVARPYQRKGLGMLIFRELHSLALKKDIDRIVVKMMRPQKGAINICKKLGFHKETVIPNYVWDQADKPQDLIIMTCKPKNLWRELEHFYSDSDWRRCR
ncbi:MAG: N-acetyltransferase [Candidatus Aminicenantes bacterium]|nr:MAG: N-acetyltransferase [Candidatus Aminicenantes bacterium]